MARTSHVSRNSHNHQLGKIMAQLRSDAKKLPLFLSARELAIKAVIDLAANATSPEDLTEKLRSAGGLSAICNQYKPKNSPQQPGDPLVGKAANYLEAAWQDELPNIINAAKSRISSSKDR